MTPKPGLKTTEFWVTMIIIIAWSIVGGLVVAFPTEMWVTIVSIVVGGIVSALTGVGYIISREKVKVEAEKK